MQQQHPPLKTKEDKGALKEWLYIKSSVTNDTVLLGIILGVELYAYLDRREEDGALVPCLKRRIVPKVTQEEIDKTREVHDQRKRDLLQGLGDTNPELKRSFEVKPEEIPTEEAALLEFFWKKYLEIEAHYEAGFVPILVGEQTAIYAAYDIVPKPKKEEPVIPKVEEPNPDTI